MKKKKMKVIIVNGTNPNADEVIAQVKKTGCCNIIFTGIGTTKAKELVINMTVDTSLSIRFKCFRKLNNASEEWVKDNFNVVSTIGDFYIGSSKNVNARWSAHKSPSRWKRYLNNPLYQDMKKYGVDKFLFQILEPVMEEYLKQVEEEIKEIEKSIK